MVTLASGLTREDTSVDQKVLILLLLLIASNVVSDKGAPSRCHLRYLAFLKQLDQVHTYDWGGLRYVSLLMAMRSCCRQESDTINPGFAGCWRILEVILALLSFLKSLIHVDLYLILFSFSNNGCSSTFLP